MPVTIFTLETLTQFKGIPQGSLRVLSRQTSCSVDLKLEREYVLYLRAGDNGNPPEIGICDRIVRVEKGREDLEYLRTTR